MSELLPEIKSCQDLLGLRVICSYSPGLEARLKARSEDLGLRILMQAIAEEQMRTATAPLQDEIGKLKAALLKPPPGRPVLARPQRPAPGFVLSTLLLSESFQYLSRRAEESLHFATGARVGESLLVDCLLPVELSTATVINAQASDSALFRLFARLDALGHTVTGVFHIHPGTGQAATGPSSVDRDYLKRLSGRRLVFGIWSRDGYLRLVEHGQDQVVLFGEGVEEVNAKGPDRIYRLVAKAPGSLLGDQPGATGRVDMGRERVRPAGAGEGL